MEIIEDYLSRKHEELQVLNDCLAAPRPLRLPRSVNEVIEHKFHIAAALKGEHALQDWAWTETALVSSPTGESRSFQVQL